MVLDRDLAVRNLIDIIRGAVIRLPETIRRSQTGRRSRSPIDERVLVHSRLASITSLGSPIFSEEERKSRLEREAIPKSVSILTADFFLFKIHPRHHSLGRRRFVDREDRKGAE